jgi:DNA-binding HxlR family transcriptional regulator
MDGPRIVERDDPEDVFTLLSDETRMEILRALWTTDDPAAFSELHEATGIRDSGQFNYHLDRLVGQFVRKTPDGYELTQAGKEINGAIEAGSYTLEATFEPIALDDPCPSCGGKRTLAYEDEVVTIECESCAVNYHFVVPPGVIAGHDNEAIPRVASRYLHTTFHQIQSGFCWFREGHTQPTVEIVEAPAESADGDDPEGGESGEADLESEASTGDTTTGDTGGDDDSGEVPIVRYDCERCGHTTTASLRLATLDHPAVRSVYHEQGIDIRNRPVREFPAFDSDHLNVRSRDPLRASVTYTVRGETLILVPEEDGEVVDVEI